VEAADDTAEIGLVAGWRLRLLVSPEREYGVADPMRPSHTGISGRGDPCPSSGNMNADSEFALERSPIATWQHARRDLGDQLLHREQHNRVVRVLDHRCASRVDTYPRGGAIDGGYGSAG
jgi:hypothetical protein